MRYFTFLFALMVLAALSFSACVGLDTQVSKTSPFNDCDGDGIPDRTDDDDDNDGFSDWLEIREGTDPCNPFERPELAEPE